MGSDNNCIVTLEDLEALYGVVANPSMVKEVDYIHAVYRPFIERAFFVVLATAGPGGLMLLRVEIKLVSYILKIVERCYYRIEEGITESASVEDF